jgi:small-conductance mechanosensitive channel
MTEGLRQGSSERTGMAAVLIAAVLAVSPVNLSARQQPVTAVAPTTVARAITEAARTAQPAGQSAALTFSNRFVVELRATVLTRPPAMRAAAARDHIERIVDATPGARASARAYDEAIVLSVGDQPVVVLFAADADPLQGEQLAAKANDAVARLQQALDEAVELRTPRRLFVASALALLVTLFYIAALWLVVRLDARIALRLGRTAERRLMRLPGGEAIARVADARTNVQRFFALVTFVLGVLLTYAWLTFVLRRFPYTRPWGESLRGALIGLVVSAAQAFTAVLPDIFTVLVIVVVTRVLSRIAALLFQAAEEERISLPVIHPETAAPTRRIVVALLWLCALVVSYPYLPGSQSEVFKGVSVFVGLLISLGSSGVMNQAMSGLMVTYSRAIKVGDFVSVAGIDGTVTAIGTLATKITTPRNEEITIPNAVAVSSPVINYTRNGAAGVLVSTSVTIGYDTPWRQVRALLELAARRTPGVRTDPPPRVLQTALEDFYVKYTLLAAPEQPDKRMVLLDRLHASILDAFNEYGVQIMSPNYEADPQTPKVVPRSAWHAAPSPPSADRDRPVVLDDAVHGV